MSHGGSTKAIVYALLANAGIAITKTFAAIISGSGSMLAEAIHSYADCSNQGLLFLGLARAKRPPTADHPLGYGKAVYFWSFIVALMLFSMGGLFAIYEGIHKVRHPQDMEHPWVAIGVLVAAIIMEGLSMAGAMREVNKVRGRRSVWRWFRSTRQSELFVVVAEDFAALVGLVLALVAVTLSFVLGMPVFDALGSIAIGVLLCCVAIAVGIEVKSLLIGESTESEYQKEIEAYLSQRESVRQVLNLITLQLGADVMVAAKVEMEAADAAQLVQRINACEDALKQKFPAVRWLFFEPDVKA